VSVGSDFSDSPEEEGDARLIPFGDVPPVIYSEVVGDLRRLAGQATTEDADDED